MKRLFSEQKHIGTGSYSTVCSARDATDKIVAVKRCQDVYFSQEDALKVLREVAILRCL